MTKPKIPIYFKHSDDYDLRPISGAWGGPVPGTPNIHVAFYCDYVAMPSQIDYEIDTDTGVATQSNVHVEQALHRQVVYGAIMTPDVAREIGKWLIEKADSAQSDTET